MLPTSKKVEGHTTLWSFDRSFVHFWHKVKTDDNLKEDFTTRYSFCNRFSCFEGVKMVKNACIFLTSAKPR